MTQFKDYFSTHSETYGLFRPVYPEALFRFLAQVAPARARAWDCATGTGQAASGLAPYFDQVIATDASRPQIEHAVAHSRVAYSVAPAEQSPLADKSIDLIAVAQAFHWFDMEKFFGEVERVLKPAGILAVWSYRLHRITPEIDAVVHKYYDKILGAYWPPERKLVDNEYGEINFPYEPLVTPGFIMEAEWAFAHLAGYLKTWSAAKLYQQKHRAEALDIVFDELAAAWGDPDQTRLAVWPLNVITRRK